MSGTPAHPGKPEHVRTSPLADVSKFNACCRELENFYAELRKTYDAATINEAELVCRNNQAL